MTEVSLKLDKGDKVSIEKSKPQAINYLRIGNGKRNRTSKLQSVDLIAEMVNMGRPELKAKRLSKKRWGKQLYVKP